MVLKTPAAVRDALDDALYLDLVGPRADDENLATEQVEGAPSRFYLTGFLVPSAAPDTVRYEEDSADAVDSAEQDPEEGDGVVREPPRNYLPSSIGFVTLLADGVRHLSVTAVWGDYVPVATTDAGEPDENGLWQRTPRRITVPLDLGTGNARPKAICLEDHGDAGTPGMKLSWLARTTVDPSTGAKVRAVSVFLVNERPLDSDKLADRAFAFQVALQATCAEGFFPRNDSRGRGGDDWDAAVADLQFADVVSFATGLGTSVECTRTSGADGKVACTSISTTAMPRYEVPKTEPNSEIPGVFEMEALGDIARDARGGAPLAEALQPLVASYRAHLEGLAAQPSGDGNARSAVRKQLLHRGKRAADRLEAGIALLAGNADARRAFSLANRAMAAAARARSPERYAKAAPTWRPFQLAFFLLNLCGLADEAHPDRSEVDLLFFPTGGGKTEAYLGLAAFTLVHRRLTHAGYAAGGVAVLMRYTLRLLTLDQLGRALGLACALERLREAENLGPVPFEVGLWVGGAATPNRLGKANDGNDESALARTQAARASGDPNQKPIPLHQCPWCGAEIGHQCFFLVGNPREPSDLRVRCSSLTCPFSKNLGLPLVAVDDVVYRTLPGFVIATVDKFANLPWIEQGGKLFGHVDAYRSGVGYVRNDEFGPLLTTDVRLEQGLPPPALIIQDELHLISGPLGSMVGLYEIAIDGLASRASASGRSVRPKLIASTATVRAAQEQIRKLYNRQETAIFPPPLPDRTNSFFAIERPVGDPPGRRYIGLAAPGRSMKKVLLRAYLVLLAAGERAAQDGEILSNGRSVADPYLTLVGYFSSLRELGGSRRLVEDEVATRLLTYASRVHRGRDRAVSSFANRDLNPPDLVELTSRLSTGEVAKAKGSLELPHPFAGGRGGAKRGKAKKGHAPVDVALATNMISVGLDIERLGLLVTFGQPKTASEYIQATSRVGRDAQRPGLVLTLLNTFRPRDRSHYEGFATFHESFYRAVEATSVTPFAPRALDRGLLAVFVALVRHKATGLTATGAAGNIRAFKGAAEAVIEDLLERAAGIEPNHAADEALRSDLEKRLKKHLDNWLAAADSIHNDHGKMTYDGSNGVPLLVDPLAVRGETQPATLRDFTAGRSLRDVEPSVSLRLVPNGKNA